MTYTAAPETAIDAIILDVEYTINKRGRSNILSLSNVVGDVPVAGILTIVRGGCDGARSEDATGFCRDDLRKDAYGLVDYLGAGNDKISFNGLEWALQMCVYYQRQWMPYFEPDMLARVKAAQKSLQDYWV